ncbi:hypothetical protein EVAR_28935_1 [Eumeta japonica]|uniref:Uncharacterized protein n=1 Tax=Eumeta variegata TaxID=151549 RepID=A0A4C1YJE1_EUMVA|nr:hypothetical protein EVAR_28935_1 [Eumeta japonica]
MKDGSGIEIQDEIKKEEEEGIKLRSRKTHSPTSLSTHPRLDTGQRLFAFRVHDVKQAGRGRYQRPHASVRGRRSPASQP